MLSALAPQNSKSKIVSQQWSWTFGNCWCFVQNDSKIRALSTISRVLQIYEIWNSLLDWFCFWVITYLRKEWKTAQILLFLKLHQKRDKTQNYEKIDQIRPDISLAIDNLARNEWIDSSRWQLNIEKTICMLHPS